jgi:PhzF family phenazine biosynthesis protein
VTILSVCSHDQVNAFADRPFSGNPACVVLIPKQPPLQWSVGDDVMQNIAREMQLSETAFVTPAEGSGKFQSSTRFLLRWFTPTKEVDLCGHATLATAAALAIECSNSAANLVFETRSGTLTATRHGDTSEFELDFPANPPCTVAAGSPEAKVHSEIAHLVLGERHSRAIVGLAYSPTTKKLVVQMDPALFGRTELEMLAVPSPDRLLAVEQCGSCPVTGVMVTVASEHKEDGYDFLSRYFAPWNGITEDPVSCDLDRLWA